MPELPDVESVVRRLRRRITGLRIVRVAVLDRAVVRSPSAPRFARRVHGRAIRDVRRRGKYLLVSLDGGLTIVAHLRMTGDLLVVPRTAPVHPHTRLVIGLGSRDLRFVDQRRFGHVDLVPTNALGRFQALRDLGVEPLSPTFTSDLLRDLLHGRRGSLKAFLLRQDLIAGIGNIYADEVLFQARLHPARPARSLRGSEVERLHHAVTGVLRRGVRALSGYRRAVGDLLLRRRRGGACPRCRGPLGVAAVAGRTTYFCPRCQRGRGPRRRA